MPAPLSDKLLADFPLGLNEEGFPIVPLNPGLARARLAEREATPGYADSLLDRAHPLHTLRTQERQGLHIVAARKS